MEVSLVVLLIDNPVAMVILPSFPILRNPTKWERFFMAVFKHYSQWDDAYMMTFLTDRLRRFFRT